VPKQDLPNSIASALGGDRKALIALARGHLGWTREEVARIGRGDPDAVARAKRRWPGCAPGAAARR
jgi:hypothetical protein